MNQYIFEPVKPVVETKFGKLRGVTYGDVNIFMGVKYAKAKRFQMPKEQESWEGIRNAYTYGPVAPLMMPDNPPSYYRGLHMSQKHGEDCQNLNIWAPKTLNGEKKPVFVWIHGGGYFGGNALEEYSFDGFNMAHNSDVVFVSINHRLNILAHLNLADYGDEFKNSVNVGIADLVAAMKWIHENISAFGGDPGNVTICGHSGGGGKVQCLYQIEEAAPYFQRGMVLSGSMTNDMTDTQESSRTAAKEILDVLGITKENIEKIYEVSYEELVGAYKKVAKKLSDSGVMVKWSPVKDDYFMGFPLDVGFMPWSSNKPLLFGSTIGEFLIGQVPGDKKAAMSDDEKNAFIKERYGDKADELIALFRKAYPDHDSFDLSCMDTMVRVPTMDTALLHSKNGLNNTYIYIASYNPPEDEYVPMWHGGDVCYILQTEDKVFVLNEAVYGQKLAQAFSAMTINYVKTGDPNNKYLPEWKNVTEDQRYTMIFDRQFRCEKDHDTELMSVLDKIAPKFVLDFSKMFRD